MSPPTRHEKVFCENFFSAAISRCAALATCRKCVCVLHSPSDENIEKKRLPQQTSLKILIQIFCRSYPYPQLFPRQATLISSAAASFTSVMTLVLHYRFNIAWLAARKQSRHFAETDH